MKSVLFHLMSYPELPEDFQQKHRSVWVDIDPDLFNAEVAHRMYNEYIDELEYAAGAGFDGVGVNEHHSNAYGLMPSPNLIAATLARSTRDVAVVVMGDSVALYNPPIRVAEEFAMLDCISGGRLVAGFPVGTPMDTTFAYGVNPATLRERYHEGMDLILEAWTRREVFSFNGKYTKLRYVNPWPRPLQSPHPPVWIPGGGSVDTWDWCARNDHLYCYLSYFGYKVGLAGMRGFWGKMEEHRKERNPFQAGFCQFLAVGETEAEARKLYREPAEYFFNRCLHVDPGFADPPGYKTANTVRAGVEGMVERAAKRAADSKKKPGFFNAGTSFEEMVDKGYIILGSPDQVAERLRSASQELHVGHLLLLCHYGNMKKDVVLHNIELTAKQVLPQIRDMYEDEWEDHWWPKTVARVGSAS